MGEQPGLAAQYSGVQMQMLLDLEIVSYEERIDTFFPSLDPTEVYKMIGKDEVNNSIFPRAGE